MLPLLVPSTASTCAFHCLYLCLPLYLPPAGARWCRGHLSSSTSTAFPCAFRCVFLCISVPFLVLSTALPCAFQCQFTMPRVNRARDFARGDGRGCLPLDLLLPPFDPYTAFPRPFTAFRCLSRALPLAAHRPPTALPSPFHKGAAAEADREDWSGVQSPAAIAGPRWAQPAARLRHSAAPSSFFSRRFSTDGEGGVS